MAKSDEAGDRVEVTHGGARATVWKRGDGRWGISWQQGGKSRNSTAKRKEDALKRAKAKVRAIAAGLGSRAVTIEDAELVQTLYRVCGERSPIAVLGELEDALKALKGVPLRTAVAHWKASGLGDVVRYGVREAINRFLDLYDKKSVWTRAGLRKELDGFRKAYAGLQVCELTQETVAAWIGRRQESGEEPGPRFFNNRLATWMNFLNRCRKWGYWPKGEKHPAELIEKRVEPKGHPPIWMPDVGHAVLDLVWKELPRQVPYLVIGYWLGLRPTEITRLRWELFDWQRSYVNLDLTVAHKTQEARFVPINAKARALLERWLREQGLWERAEAGTLTGKCALRHDREFISLKAREAKLIAEWEQDVLRHSYISFQIALGHAKHQIAEWAGNSEGVIRRKYRRPLMRQDGEAWALLQ